MTRSSTHSAERLEQFNRVTNAIANETDESVLRPLINELYGLTSLGSPERYLDLYLRTRTPYAKSEFVILLWMCYRDRSGEREKGFFVMLDYLYSRQIGNGNIHVILQKYPLLPSTFTLTTDECESVVKVMLDFLSTNPAVKWNFLNKHTDEYLQSCDRTYAARLLSVLYHYAATPELAKERLFGLQWDLIIDYHYDERNDDFDPSYFAAYLVGKI